jgi:hypothetical protein
MLDINSTVRRLRIPDSTGSRKAPDVTFIRIFGIELIDAPVINLLPFKCAGIIGCRYLRCTIGSVTNIFKIVT